MDIVAEMPIDFRKFRKEFVQELIDLQKQYQDEFVKWAAEKLAAARMEYGSKTTEETEGYQVLPFSKTPRVGRATKSRQRMEVPNENEDVELCHVESSKEEEEGTKRVTRTATRRALSEVNAVQEAPTTTEPKPALVKRQTRGRKRKSAEEVTVPPTVVGASKRMTRAASRKAAAAKQVINLVEEEDMEEEVLSSQQDGELVESNVGSNVETGILAVDETLSLQPSTVSELHVEDTEDDTDGTDCDAAGEANTRKHAKRAKTSTSRSTKGRQRAGNQNRKQSKQKKTSTNPSPASQPPFSPLPHAQFLPSSPPPTHPATPPPPPTQPPIPIPLPEDTEEGKELEQPQDVSQSIAMEESPPPDEVPAEVEGTACDEKDDDTERCGMDVSEQTGAVASKDQPSVDEGREGVDSLVLVEENGSSSKMPSPDLLTPYMKNSPFKVAGLKEDDEGSTGEHSKRGTFSESVVDEDGAGQQREESEGSGSASVTQTEQVAEGEQGSDRDEQALKSAKRKAVVQSFFHHPLTRNRLEGGSVARLVRDYEAHSATRTPQTAVAVESGIPSPSSSKPLPHQRSSPKATPSMKDNRTLFFSSLLEKHKGKKKEGMQDLSSQPQSVEAVVPNQQQQVTQTPSGDTMTRAALNSFFDSLLKKQKSVHRGKPEDAKEESNDKSEEQGESPTLRETETAPELKKQKTGDSLEEYLTADEREDSIEEAPSKAVREEEHSPDTQNTNSEACKEVVSPEEASEVSPPAAGSEDLPSTSVLQSSSSFANSAFWEAWHASNKGGKSTQLKHVLPHQKENMQVTFLQSGSAAYPSYSTTTMASSTTTTCVSSPKKKPGMTGVTAKLGNMKFLSLLKGAPPQKDPQSAASSVPPTVTSFLPCPPSPTKHQSLKERAHELKQRLEEKDRKLKEFELHRHQEHKDKFKKQKERALLVSQRRAQLEEEEEAKRLQQLAKKEDLLSKKRTNLLNKKQKELDDLRRKQEEQAHAVLQRKKQQEIEFQKKLQAQLEEEERVAAENEKKRVEYEERERQRRKAEEDRKRKAGEHLNEEIAKKQGPDHDDGDTVSGKKLTIHVPKLQHPLGNTFNKPPPYQQTGANGGSKLLRPGFASPHRQAQVAMPAPSFISPQTSGYTQSKLRPAVTPYAMTPDVFGEVESYDIQDLGSSDDTDDEETTTKPIPTWARPQQLKLAMLEQESKNWDIESIFPPPQLPIDLVKIFRRKRTRYHQRTSSVNWDTPPKSKKKYYV